MKFKNILNKPYKYGYLYKYNKYYNNFTVFTSTDQNYFNSLLLFNITKKQFKGIISKYSNNVYKSFIILKFFKYKLDIKLIEMGITKTIKQSKYLVIYGKILVNGRLCKNPNTVLKVGDCIKIVPTLHNITLYNNLYLFKNYLLKANKINNIIQNNILNINKNTLFLLKTDNPRKVRE